MGGCVGALLSVLVLGFLSNSSGNASSTVVSQSGNSSNKCENLIQDLKSMQGAQKELLQSFMKKNETMAEVLDQQADRLEKNLVLHQSLKKYDLSPMHVSAEAFRSHRVKEAQIVDRFGKASGELLEQVKACLAVNSKIAEIVQK